VSTDLPSMSDLRDRYQAVRQRIAAAAKRSGRRAESVLLVAVTKNAEPDQIRELIRLGQTDFAENRVQQLIQRAPMLDEWLARHRSMPGVQWPRASGTAAGAPDALGAEAPAGTIRWHMIGHLQRNKARKVVELCRLIHSVDSLRLAEEIQLIAAKREKPVEVLLQVNCSGETSKYGCAIGAAIHLAEQIETMIQVRLRGLMTMAPYSENPEEARATFARARELFTEIRDSGVVNPQFNILSMGMSGDFEVAIEEGANLVRVGSALFGEPRPGQADEDDREGGD
jgi:PLP dependent protein